MSSLENIVFRFIPGTTYMSFPSTTWRDILRCLGHDLNILSTRYSMALGRLSSPQESYCTSWRGESVLLARTSDLFLILSLLVDKLSHTVMACPAHCNAIGCQRHVSDAAGLQSVVSCKVLLTTIGRNRNLGTLELACSLLAISLRTACSTSAGDGRMVISGWAGHGQCTHSILIKQEGMPPSSMVLLAYSYYSRPPTICREILQYLSQLLVERRRTRRSLSYSEYSVPASVVLTASSQIWRFIAFPTTGTRHRVPQNVQPVTSIHASHISILVHGQLRSYLPRLLRLTAFLSLRLRALAQLRIHPTSPLARPSRHVQINLSIQSTQLATA